MLLVEPADRLALTAALTEAMVSTRERRSAHGPGVVLGDLAVAVADGGDHVSDLGVLRGQEPLCAAGIFPGASADIYSVTDAHRDACNLCQFSRDCGRNFKP